MDHGSRATPQPSFDGSAARRETCQTRNTAGTVTGFLDGNRKGVAAQPQIPCGLLLDSGCAIARGDGRIRSREPRSGESRPERPPIRTILSQQKQMMGNRSSAMWKVRSDRGVERSRSPIERLSATEARPPAEKRRTPAPNEWCPSADDWSRWADAWSPVPDKSSDRPRKSSQLSKGRSRLSCEVSPEPATAPSVRAERGTRRTKGRRYRANGRAQRLNRPGFSVKEAWRDGMVPHPLGLVALTGRILATGARTESH